MKRSLVFLLSCVLLVFGVLFEGCKDGQELQQQQPEEIAKGVEGLGTRPDPCESAHHKENKMCSWVLQTMEGESDQGKKYKAVSEFDEMGRVTNFRTYEDNDKEVQRTAYFYSDFGTYKVIQLTNPSPPGSENFLDEVTTDTYYKPDGSIERKEVTYKNKQGVTGSTDSLYDYTGGGMQGSYLLITHELKNELGVKYGQNLEYFFKDPLSGKLGKADKRNFPALNAFCKSWEVSTYGYNSDGRMNSLKTEIEDCSVTTPGGDCLNSPISPTSITESTEIKYDDKGRLTLLAASMDGIPGQNPPDMPDGNPDGSISIEFKYDWVSQNPANEHPIFVSDPILRDLGLGSNEVVTNLIGKVSPSGPNFEMKFGWVRLWEALPGGHAPE